MDDFLTCGLCGVRVEYMGDVLDQWIIDARGSFCPKCQREMVKRLARDALLTHCQPFAQEAAASAELSGAGDENEEGDHE